MTVSLTLAQKKISRILNTHKLNDAASSCHYVQGGHLIRRKK